MKKTLRKNGRHLLTLILTISMMLSMVTNVFAGWATYNGTTYSSGNVYLEEKWYGTQQIIHYYCNGGLARSVASQGNTLWIDSQPRLNNLYDTCYWCYDKYGNVFAIDTAQNLLLARNNTNTFVVNTSIVGCTGFQRDNGKIGYLVYTNNGSYSLEELLRGNNFYINNNNSYNSNVQTYYPNVQKSGSYYYYYTSANKYYKYYLSGSTLYYKGTNSSSSNTKLATSVDEVTFWPNGYIVYATTSNYVYAYSLGKTTSSYKITIGKYFDHFDEYYEDYMSMGYYNTSGNYKEFSVYDNDDDYRYSESYPYVQKSGSYYYYYTSSSRYYKYYLSGSTLYYKGTNSNSSNTKLATSVDEITFSPDGYIVYSVNDSYDRVYAYPVGKTSSSYKETVGKYFDCFDEDYGDYMSSGYYDRYDDFIDFDF